MICSSPFLLQYFVSNDMVEAPQPTIQMMPTNTTTASGHTIVDTQSLHHSGKIRIVNNDDVAAALQPTRKIITINNQQYVVSQGGQGNFETLFSKFSIILKFSKILGISINYHAKVKVVA